MQSLQEVFCGERKSENTCENSCTFRKTYLPQVRSDYSPPLWCNSKHEEEKVINPAVASSNVANVPTIVPFIQQPYLPTLIPHCSPPMLGVLLCPVNYPGAVFNSLALVPTPANVPTPLPQIANSPSLQLWPSHSLLSSDVDADRLEDNFFNNPFEPIASEAQIRLPVPSQLQHLNVSSKGRSDTIRPMMLSPNVQSSFIIFCFISFY